MSDLCMGASSVSRNMFLPSICLARTEIMLSQNMKELFSPSHFEVGMVIVG